MTDTQHRIERVMQKAFEKPWKCIGKRKNEFAYQVPTGLSHKDLEQHLDELYASCGAVIELKEYAGVVVIKVNPDDFPLSIPYEEEMLKQAEGRAVVIGYDRSMTPMIHNFKVPHLMIAGQSGYGKTDLLRWILFQLIHRFTPDQLQITIIDMKGFSFLPFRDVPHVKVVRDLAGVHSVLKEGKEIMTKRSEIVWNSNDRGKTQNFKWHLIVIDEASQISPLLMRDKASRELALECDEFSASISAIGREASVSLFYCTQRPDATVINPLVKANMEGVISFKTRTEVNSMIVLDRTGAEKLPFQKAGRCLYLADDLTELQVPYIGKDDKWDELLKPYQGKFEEFSKRMDEGEQEGTKTHDGSDNDERFTDCLNNANCDLFQGNGITAETGVGNYDLFREGGASRGETKGNRKGENMASVLKWSFPNEGKPRPVSPELTQD